MISELDALLQMSKPEAGDPLVVADEADDFNKSEVVIDSELGADEHSIPPQDTFNELDEGLGQLESPEQEVHIDHEAPLEQGDDAEEEDDVIDIDDPEDLAAKGLKRITIEGEEEEFLLDLEGNIFNLKGEFVGTADGDVEETTPGDAVEDL